MQPSLRILSVAAMLLVCTVLRAAGPKESWVLENFSEQEAKCAIAAINDESRICGLWQTTDHGSTIVILPGNVAGTAPGLNNHCLLLVALRAARPLIPPGTVVGWAFPTAKNDTYAATMFTNADGELLNSPKEFLLRINDVNHLSLIKIRKGIEVMAWRLLPYLYRGAVRKRDDRPRDLDGLLRMWPEDPQTPLSPKIL